MGQNQDKTHDDSQVDKAKAGLIHQPHEVLRGYNRKKDNSPCLVTENKAAIGDNYTKLYVCHKRSNTCA